MRELRNVTNPSQWARASHTNLDMRAKREVLPVFFDVVAE